MLDMYHRYIVIDPKYSTSTRKNYYTGLIETSKKHFYGRAAAGPSFSDLVLGTFTGTLKLLSRMSNHLTGRPPATPVIVCTVTGHTFSRKVFQGPSLAASSASATACSARDWHRRDARSTEVARYRTLIPEGTGPARRWQAPSATWIKPSDESLGSQSAQSEYVVHPDTMSGHRERPI